MKLVFATQNKNKVNEIRAILGDNFELLTLSEINCNEEVPETQDTIEGNASQKSFYIYEKYNVNCFADDTGLEIDHLGGAPGVYSARYSGEPQDYQRNIDKVLTNMQDATNRKAQFKTVISLIINGHETLFEGIIEGEITTGRQGTNGFGYDPIFRPRGYEQTFGEMDAKIKNLISHRAIATQKLINYLLSLQQ